MTSPLCPDLLIRHYFPAFPCNTIPVKSVFFIPAFEEITLTSVSDISEDGYPISRERRDYRGLIKVHKSKRKLPELPSDPKMSIFNNIDRLGGRFC